jgi:hypothetical protein
MPRPSFGILIQQRFVDKTVQRLLTQGFHVPFVRRQLRELVAQLLLHTVTFTGKSILELPRLISWPFTFAA